MKILHLSTHQFGGAGTTARNMVELQNSFGHNAFMLTIENQTSRKIISKFSTAASILNAKGQYEQLTSYSASGLSLNTIEKFDPEIIFIHNWFNLISISQLGGIAKKYKIVFVAHDERLLTGGCHITFECERYLSKCIECPAAHIKYLPEYSNKALYSGLKDMTNIAVVSPSNWLLKKFSNSQKFRNAAVLKHIPNPVNKSFLEFNPGRNSRDNNNPRLLFVAANVETPLKGFDTLVDALSILSKSKFGTQLSLNVIGKSRYKGITKLDSNLKVNFLGQKNSIEIRNEMLNSDFLIVPSFSENFPGVIAEAQLSKCVAVGSNVGGIPEMIENGETGFIFETNADSLANTLIKVFGFPKLDDVRERAFDIATKRHNPTSINDSLNEVIDSLCA